MLGPQKEQVENLVSYRRSLRQSQRQPSASHLPIVCTTSSPCRLSLYSSSRLVAASPYLSESPYLSAIGVFLPLPNFVSSSRFFFRPPCSDLQLRPCVIPYTPSPFRQTGQQCGKSEALASSASRQQNPGPRGALRRLLPSFLCIVVAFGPSSPPLMQSVAWRGRPAALCWLKTCS